MIDSHSHIHMCENPDLEIEKAITNGVNEIINIFDLSEIDEKSINFWHKEFTEIKILKCTGVHPLRTSSFNIENFESEILKVAHEICAIGETGLDLHFPEHQNKEEQIMFFIKSLELCEKLKKTTVIHWRTSPLEILLEEIKKYNTKFVFHCFTGNKEDARKILDLGGIISFSGIITFKNSLDIREAMEFCPLDRILLETDSPFLAPVPFRGKPNGSFLIPYVYEEGAKIKKANLDDFKNIIIENFHKTF